MKISKLTGIIGAELLNVDISRDLSDNKISDIRQALLENYVVFFRDQNLTPEEHIRFAQCFGEISKSPVYKTMDEYPQIMPIIKNPTDKDVIGDTWHTDETYQTTPPMGSLLYAREVPEVGGDTLFCNLYRAYDTLSEEMKEMLKKLRAVHSNELLNAGKRNSTRSTKLRDDIGDIETSHPVIRRHEETGKELLFVNKPFTMYFEGMSKEESAPLLQHLYAHSSKPENTCRFRWKKGSLAFWDNRCTMHYAINDYPGQRREMHRITIEGQVPSI
ncbi:MULTISPECIES: TauD/TfdA family dioxygenase [unclassified Comamonas]|uniref:TauD/TfdA dioxygenase family protein n=1 Tax=unclassified Comamonas TaxID=2638500 RepID=UPI001FA7C203|nr:MULTISPECIES: TauD/TfdA family dioxygenase [unclassified Comamonas]UNV88718.1 TauD/TfdA family dioxygenase [Comamonas sp. 7D-2evo1]UNV93377.1 TauD/TfdA family dioxygenase [Comamonas sp. 7D-2]UNV98361.1 TauD/TfdA family dioxygenase [Comamonas sp. 7D-2evo2]